MTRAGYSLVGALIFTACCIAVAVRATDRDLACAARGGHLEGLVAMRCVRDGR